MNVALDPANDLGLGSSNTNTPAGMQDISSFSTNSASQVAQDMAGSMSSTAPVATQVESLVPENYVPNMQEPILHDLPMQQNDTAGNFLFVVSVVLFCVSLGVAVFFALQYFKVI